MVWKKMYPHNIVATYFVDQNLFPRDFPSWLHLSVTTEYHFPTSNNIIEPLWFLLQMLRSCFAFIDKCGQFAATYNQIKRCSAIICPFAIYQNYLFPYVVLLIRCDCIRLCQWLLYSMPSYFSGPFSFVSCTHFITVKPTEMLIWVLFLNTICTLMFHCGTRKKEWKNKPDMSWPLNWFTKLR